MKFVGNIAIVASTAMLCGGASAQFPGTSYPGAPYPGAAPGIGGLVGNMLGGMMQPGLRQNPMMIPPNSRAAQQAANPNNPLSNSAADKLEKVSEDLKDALKTNPFFQLSGIAMQIREMATTNPKALQGAGVFVVELPDQDQSNSKKANAEQGIADIIAGKSTPCAKIAREEMKEAQGDLSDLISPENQAQLEKTMTPQERVQYNQRRISQIKNEISIEKKKIERAKKQIRKDAQRREQ